MKRQLEELSQYGFVSTYSITGTDYLMSVHFDSQHSWIAFVWTNGWRCYDFDELIKWEHTWVPFSSGRYTYFYHSVQYTVRDIENPLYKVVLNSDQCDLLAARTTVFVDSSCSAPR